MFLGAFFGLTHSITGEPGTTWARLAWAFAIIGVGLGLAFMLTEVVALSALADAWATADQGNQGAALAAGGAIFQLSLTLAAGASLFLFGTTPVLCGLAMLTSREYQSWQGWVGVVIGSISALGGAIQLFTGVTTLTGLVLVPIGILAVTLWIIYLGVVMVRASAAVEDLIASG